MENDHYHRVILRILEYIQDYAANVRRNDQIYDFIINDQELRLPQQIDLINLLNLNYEEYEFNQITNSTVLVKT